MTWRGLIKWTLNAKNRIRHIPFNHSSVGLNGSGSKGPKSGGGGGGGGERLLMTDNVHKAEC